MAKKKCIEKTGSMLDYSALRNDRPIFKKVAYDFFVYTVTYKQRFLTPTSDGD